MDESATLITGQANTDTGQGNANADANANGNASQDQGNGATSELNDAGKAAAAQGDQGAADGADGKNADDGKGGAKAPEQYEAFNMPDGVKLNDEIVGEFQGLAKELNLSQDAAQKVADLGAKMAQKAAADQVAALAQARGEWVTQVKADKEIGGDKLDENLGTAKKALDTFATPDLKKLLNDSGLGDHPEVIRTFYRVGKAISEDQLVNGQRGAVGPRSREQVLYPNQQQA